MSNHIPPTESIEVAAIAAALSLTFQQAGARQETRVFEELFPTNYATIVNAVNENRVLPATQRTKALPASDKPM